MLAGNNTGYTGKENVPFQAQDFFRLLIFISHNLFTSKIHIMLPLNFISP
jgi:hypothetical protein